MTPEMLFVVAAGSGGHILPAITLAHEWQQAQPDRVITFFTGSSPLERHIISQQRAMPTVFTSLAKVSKKHWFRGMLFIPQAFCLLIQSLYLALVHRPERVITTGGIHAIPVCIGAWLARRPIDLYELNVTPGKAIMLLKAIATNVFCVFDEAKEFLPMAQTVPYPLRRAIQKNPISHTALIAEINAKQQNKNHWIPFTCHRKTIFILGGSQGSLLLNKFIKNFLLAHPNIKTQIQLIHQTGAFEEANWEAFYQEHGIAAISFSYDPLITLYYQAADLIICRAGAGTLFEIAYFERPCIVVPLIAHSTDHQVHNAQAMAKKYPHLFTVTSQTDLLHNPEALFQRIKAIL
jgi:UDP-N-acetylglucosamine--N-acetylmuramyl-(pentapeptide) pyrophosphoryl-undecaprenol N-acetylglucosamine transferase